MNWIDAHCHYASPLYDARRATLDAELYSKGCRALVMAGIDAADWERQQKLESSHLLLLKSYGLHPWTVHEQSEEELETQFAALPALLKDATSLGEIGLDYYRGPDEESRKKQKRWFQKQLDLGMEGELPIILHVVRAHHDVLPVLRKIKKKQRGIVHSFWADPKIAQEYVDKGWLLSLPPRILHRDDHGLLKVLGPDDFVFESDCPDKMPDGSQSTPLKLLPVFEKAAESLGVSVDTLHEQQTKNLSRLFPQLKGISDVEAKRL